MGTSRIVEKGSLRIAVFAERFPGTGGGIATAHDGLGRLLETRHSVEYFAFEPCGDAGTETIHRTAGSRLLGGLFAGLLSLKVRRHSRSGRISAVRRIGQAIPCVRSLSGPLRRFQPQVVIMPDDQVPLLSLRIPDRAKVVWVAHHNYQRFREQPYLEPECSYDLFLAHRLERRAAARCHFAVFPSAYMESVFRRTLRADVPGKVIRNVLPPFSSLPGKVQLRKELGLPDHGPGICLPSAGTTVKGERFVPELIRRIRSAVPDAFFVITGPVYSWLAPELPHLCMNHRVFAPGALARDQSLRWTAACDICISPALLENYSCALLECQGLGLPVVTFDVGGNGEIVEDGASGLVVPFPDVDSLVNAGVRLLSDAPLRHRMGVAAKERFSMLTDSDVILAEWDTVFRSLTAGVTDSGETG